MANIISALPYPFSNKIKIDRNEKLGEGNSSVVFRGTYEGKDVAVKRNQLICLTPNEFIQLAKLQHENVIKMLTVEDDLDFRYIVLELCSATLYDVMNNKSHGFLLSKPDKVIFQTVTGLNYIHSQNLVHLDVKPQNILISEEGQIKWTDFGSCMETEDGICVINGSSRGTNAWMAPEVCQVQGNSVQVTAKADVFACGCVIFAFLTRNKNGWIHPFGNKNDPTIVQFNIRENRPINKDKLKHKHLADVVHKMIENKPGNRATLEEVKEKLLLIRPSSIRYNINQTQ